MEFHHQPLNGTKYTEEDIKALIKKYNVQFIKLQFVDINGQVKNLAIPSDHIDRILNNEIMLDGSSIKGFRNIETSDMFFYPDKNTFQIIPWQERDGRNSARLICDIYNADGTPFEGCPRCNLKRLMAEADKLGFSMNIGPEAEFFLFEKDGKSITTKTHDKGGYYDMGPDDLGESVRADIVSKLQEMGFDIEASHHEVSDGQHEIDFKYSDILTAADNVATFRIAVKVVAAQHGLHATFMPKPVFGINGSGMHCNISLFDKKGKNAFYDEKAEYQLSDTAKYSIGGILKHIKSITAILNPTVNSYKRIVPGYEAPVYMAWSLANRSALLRVPAKRGISTRVELRSPDPSCNPYLAFATILAACLDGVRNKIEPPKPVEANIYKLSDKERKRLKIEALPGSLKEALDGLEKSLIAKTALGTHILDEFLTAKSLEWDDFRTYVSQWEIDKYLAKY